MAPFRASIYRPTIVRLKGIWRKGKSRKSL